MRKWDVYIQALPGGANGRPIELRALLDDGWEPFGFVTHGKLYVALRRQREDDAGVEEQEEEPGLFADEIFLR